MDTLKLPFYARVALILIAVVLIYFILGAAANIFIPLLFALLIAILLLPVSRFFERTLRMGRIMGPLLSVFLFLSAIISLVYFLALQLAIFSNDIPILRVRFLEMFDSLQRWTAAKIHITAGEQTEYINRSTMHLLDVASNSISNVVFSISGVLLLLIFIFIFTFFLLYYRKLLVKFMLHLFSEQYQPKVTEVIMETKSMINAYITALVIEMFLVGMVTCATLLAMEIRYPFLLGIMVALLNVIPYLGFYASVVICMLVTLTNSTGAAALQAGLALFIIHLLDANVLFPRVIGGRVKMNPFVTIIAVILGEQVWGIPGMFLFIPIAGIIKLICERVDGLNAWGILIGVDE